MQGSYNAVVDVNGFNGNVSQCPTSNDRSKCFMTGSICLNFALPNPVSPQSGGSMRQVRGMRFAVRVANPRPM